MQLFTATTALSLLWLNSVVTAKPRPHIHALHAIDQDLSNNVPKPHVHHVHKRSSGQCQFPTDAGLVAVTPNEQNAGWAMSPDQPCQPGMYCPYACPAGQVGLQWDPLATSYTYPISQNGGLYCNENGEIEKPFPNKDYCADGVGSTSVNNTCGGVVAFCQTVLPGNEAMIIPTEIYAGSSQIIAVPDPSYWVSTAAHYYINAPGVSIADGCIWGTKENPVGNWSPYVAGANADASGNTYVKIGWNPVYLEQDCPFKNTLPTFGVRLVCDGTCVGLPCAIDPSTNGVNEVTSSLSSDGAGGGAFCVGTAQPGSSMYIEVFEVGSGSSSSTSGSVSFSESSNSDSQGSSSDSSSSSAQSSSNAPSSSSEAAQSSPDSSSAPQTSPDSTSIEVSSSAVLPSTSQAPSSSSAPVPTTSSIVISTSSVYSSPPAPSTSSSSLLSSVVSSTPSSSSLSSSTSPTSSAVTSSSAPPSSSSSSSPIITSSSIPVVTTTVLPTTSKVPTSPTVVTKKVSSLASLHLVRTGLNLQANRVSVGSQSGTSTSATSKATSKISSKISSKTSSKVSTSGLSTYDVSSVATLLATSRTALYNLASNVTTSMSVESSAETSPVTTSSPASTTSSSSNAAALTMSLMLVFVSSFIAVAFL